MNARLLSATIATLVLTLPISAEEPKFISLFDGKTLDGWTTAAGKPVTQGWVVEDGTIHRSERGGDIITAQKFGDFELYFEWKIAPGGNSGVKYRLVRHANRFFGCEYQLLDDTKHSNAKNPMTSNGSLYQLAAPSESKPQKPAGEWNTAKIIVQGPRLEHWLNGAKIMEIHVGSDEWNKVFNRSKYKSVPGFGESNESPILLQDHGNQIWFRDIKIRPLNGDIQANQ